MYPAASSAPPSVGRTDPSVSSPASSAIRRVSAKSGLTTVQRPADALTLFNSLCVTNRLKTTSRSANSRSIASWSVVDPPPTMTSQPIAAKRCSIMKPPSTRPVALAPAR